MFKRISPNDPIPINPIHPPPDALPILYDITPEIISNSSLPEKGTNSKAEFLKVLLSIRAFLDDQSYQSLAPEFLELLEMVRRLSVSFYQKTGAKGRMVNGLIFGVEGSDDADKSEYAIEKLKPVMCDKLTEMLNKRPGGSAGRVEMTDEKADEVFQELFGFDFEEFKKTIA